MLRLEKGLWSDFQTHQEHSSSRLIFVLCLSFSFSFWHVEWGSEAQRSKFLSVTITRFPLMWQILLTSNFPPVRSCFVQNGWWSWEPVQWKTLFLCLSFGDKSTPITSWCTWMTSHLIISDRLQAMMKIERNVQWQVVTVYNALYCSLTHTQSYNLLLWNVFTSRQKSLFESWNSLWTLTSCRTHFIWLEYGNVTLFFAELDRDDVLIQTLWPTAKWKNFIY